MVSTEIKNHIHNALKYFSLFASGMLHSMVHVFYSLMNLMLCVQRQEAVEMNKRIESLHSFLLFLMVWNLEVNSSSLEQQTDQMLLTLHAEDQADWIREVRDLNWWFKLLKT